MVTVAVRPQFLRYYGTSAYKSISGPAQRYSAQDQVANDNSYRYSNANVPFMMTTMISATIVGYGHNNSPATASKLMLKLKHAIMLIVVVVVTPKATVFVYRYGYRVTFTKW